MRFGWDRCGLLLLHYRQRWSHSGILMNPRATGKVCIPAPGQPRWPLAPGECVFWFLRSSTWSTPVCVCVVYLICEEVTGVSCSNPVGPWPLICFPGCHYRHFQNLIPKEIQQVGFHIKSPYLTVFFLPYPLWLGTLGST